ncbi:hypothetical protein D3C75_1237850 [compost metagenome]
MRKGITKAKNQSGHSQNPTSACHSEGKADAGTVNKIENHTLPLSWGRWLELVLSLEPELVSINGVIVSVIAGILGH